MSFLFSCALANRGCFSGSTEIHDRLCWHCCFAHPVQLKKFITDESSASLQAEFTRVTKDDIEPETGEFHCISRRKRYWNESWVAKLVKIKVDFAMFKERKAMDDPARDKECAECAQTSEEDVLCEECVKAVHGMYEETGEWLRLSPLIKTNWGYKLDPGLP